MKKLSRLLSLFLYITLSITAFLIVARIPISAQAPPGPVPTPPCPTWINPGPLYKNQPIKFIYEGAKDANGNPIDPATIQYMLNVLDSSGNLVTSGTFYLDQDPQYWYVTIPQLNPGDYKAHVFIYLPSGNESCSTDSFTVPDKTLVSGQNPCGPNGCPTALGNISTDPALFIQRILQIAIGVAGGIALILMVIGSIRVLTSSGDQQKLAGGRDMIVAAISGLIFLILSVTILKFIGISIIGFL